MTLLPVIARVPLSSLEKDARWFCGIDVGTTNSLVAVVDASAIRTRDWQSAVRTVPIRQPTRDGVTESVLFPSVVAEVFPGEWVTGLAAKEARGHGLRKDRQIFYSSKSEMGLGREPYYPFASSAKFDTPYKVAGEILRNLASAVELEFGTGAVANLVVTVPASFQVSARKDTLRAAQIAGIHLGEQALLDEPNAAFLDYLLTVASQDACPLDFSTPTLILVVDFGGGTCDASVLRVRFQPQSGRLELANLAISRYERLGGDNIDTAIVEKILLPRLLRQNGIHALDLTWAEKKNFVLPQLLPLAEALKLAICSEYSAQLELHSEQEIRRDTIRAAQLSASIAVPAQDRIRTLSLREPSLTLTQFEDVMAPFIDRDLIYAHGTEFNSVTSVFAPVQDALDRAALSPCDIDGILLVGGSSLIPQVQLALGEYFPESRRLRFPSAERSVAAVARGAALHSFFLHGLRLPLLKPIAQETIGLLARGNAFCPLIHAGTELPFPATDNFATHRGLSVPRDLMPELDIVIAAEAPIGENKVLAVAHIRPDDLPRAGDEIEVRFRLDANKLLQLEASLISNPQARCTVSLENPLSSTGHETERQKEILRLEQELADAIIRRQSLSEKVLPIERLSERLFDEKKYERAIDWAKKALQLRGTPDVFALNLIGNAYSELGAYDRAEKFYREVTNADPSWGGGHFNLALSMESQGRTQDAVAAVSEAVRLDLEEGAYRALHARLLKKLGNADKAKTVFHEAARLLDLARPLSEFQLCWRQVAAHGLNDSRTLRELEAARQRQADDSRPYDPAALPKTAEALVRRRG